MISRHGGLWERSLSGPDEVYLSTSLIREWKAEYEAAVSERNALVVQIHELQQKQSAFDAKIQSLTNKIKSATPFAPDLSEWLEEQSFNQSNETLALPDAILKLMIRIFPMNGHVQAFQIQQHLPQVGYPQQKLSATPNYLGIALKRLVGRNLLAESPKGQFRLTTQGRMHAQQLR